MARKPREEVAGGLFHVFARGNGKQVIYLDDDDCRTYLRMLGKVVKKRSWRCLAYCLMENHVHLLLETPDANLAVGMQWLHSLYAQTFNERHDRSGHLFQGRYGAVRMKTDEQLWMAARYIAVNPVEAGLCERPEEWRWSSHATVVRSRPPDWLAHSRLLEYFAAAGGDPRDRYAAMVAAPAA